jgi:hypothetical protein
MIPFEEDVELCRYFQFERLKQLVAEEPNDLERDCLLTSTFFILDTEVKADYLDTLKWGEYYLDYLANHAHLPPEQNKPRSDILKRMEIIYENCDMLDHALWICDVADFHGIQKDGTRAGFLGRRKRLEERRKRSETEQGKYHGQT